MYRCAEMVDYLTESAKKEPAHFEAGCKAHAEARGRGAKDGNYE